MIRFSFLLFLFVQMSFAQEDLVTKLQSTRAINTEEMMHKIELLSFSHGDRRFIITDPYKLSENDNNHEEVCAVKFTDANKKYYELQTFSSKTAALGAGYIITHFNHCGACSTLQDLSVYIGKPDLTMIGKKCSRKLNKKKVKKCYEKVAGFTRLCAEAWTYNSKNTKKECLRTCIKDYGLWAILRNAPSTRVDNLPDGTLRPCILCDEVKSGPGFKYVSGRTRRNSGLISSIRRESLEVLEVDHNLYFKE